MTILRFVVFLTVALRLSAAIGDNAPSVPSTWVASHPRLGAPDNTFLLSVYNSGSLPARYVTGANAWDSTCTTTSCGGSSAPWNWYYLLASIRAYEVGHTGGCNISPCTGWLTKFLAMMDMGTVWGAILVTDDHATGDGAGTVTDASVDFTTACGGTCVGASMAILGNFYAIATVGTPNIHTATVTRVGAFLPYPYPSTATSQKMRIFDTNNVASSVTTGFMYAWGYDWLYADLSTQQKADAVTAMINFMALVEHDYLEGDQVTIGEYPYNDQGYCNGGGSWIGCLGLFAPAMAVYPDGGAAALPHWRWMADNVFNYILPVWQQVMRGGGWPESWPDYQNSSQGPQGIHAYIPSLFLMWANASGTGVSTFFNDSRYSFLHSYGLQLPYLIKPDGNLVKLGDTAIPTPSQEYVYPNSGIPTFGGLAEIYNDPTQRGWARLMSGNTSPDGFQPSALPWYTPDNSGNTITNPGGDPRVDLPLVKDFTGWGQAIFRCGWTETDCWISLHYGDYFNWGHGHGDAGDYTVYKDGNLIIESGSYAAGISSYTLAYYAKQSVAHNVPAIWNSGETFSTEWNAVLKADGSVPCFHMFNDGGQRRIAAWAAVWNSSGCSTQLTNAYTSHPIDLAAWNRGREFYHTSNLLAFVCSPNCTSPAYAYVSVDLTAAYNNTLSGSALSVNVQTNSRTQRAQSVVRNFLVVFRGHSAYVAVADTIKTLSSSYVVLERMHTISEPTISGAQVTITRADNALGKPLGYINPTWQLPLLANANTSNTKYQYGGKAVMYGLFDGASPCNIGGNGHEFDDGTGVTSTPCSLGTNQNECQQNSSGCDGANTYGFGNTVGFITPNVSPADPTYGLIEPGSWRVEEQATGKTSYFFTNLMLATANADTNLPSTPSTSTGGSGGSAYHQIVWTDSGNGGGGTCTYTWRVYDSGVGGTFTETGSPCYHVVN